MLFIYGNLKINFAIHRVKQLIMLVEKTHEVIDSNLLIVWGGVFKNYDKGDYIFHEGGHAHFYHQVIEGRVKMVSEAETGKEFIQGFFTDGQSFGEPPIFEGSEYPASAIAQQPSVIIRLNVPSFIQLLKENFDIHWTITKLIAQRILSKALTLKEISCNGPEERILSILNHYKKDKLNGHTTLERIKIDYTRQQIADMSGLRVETVIRAMRNLNEKEILTIKGGKVFY
jgi:CRP/FNR family transcriptional regulator, cyclic AMP receptor protein